MAEKRKADEVSASPASESVHRQEDSCSNEFTIVDIPPLAACRRCEAIIARVNHYRDKLVSHYRARAGLAVMIAGLKLHDLTNAKALIEAVLDEVEAKYAAVCEELDQAHQEVGELRDELDRVTRERDEFALQSKHE